MSGLIEWAIFLGLAAVAVVTAAGMLLTMSMYRAGLALMSSFVALAGLFILLDADLMALIQLMMNVGGMMVMILFMVMLMMDPGGEMMWEMKRKMNLPGPGAFSMSMPRHAPPDAVEENKESQAATASDWTCPMHPEVSAEGAGDCPKCGMPLVPRAETESGSPTAGGSQTYTCPMHPEVRQYQPGQCPLCGMPLVPSGEPPATESHAGSHGHAGTPGARDDATATATYTCPMHPEVRQQGAAGTCPKCGMELMPAEEAETQVSQHRDADGREGAGMKESRGGVRGTGTARMSPRQHYRMMVDMAMSTAQLPWALAVGAASGALLVVLMVRTPWTLSPAGPAQDSTTAVGELLLSRYMVAFEGAAFLILAGMVGAVIFAKRETSPAPLKEALADAAGSEVYTCPMHSQVRQAGPGSCPVCGMDLVPAGQLAARDAGAETHNTGESHMKAETHGTAETYTCPMHPEVRQDRPGRCPKCGMPLVPAAEAAAEAGHEEQGGDG